LVSHIISKTSHYAILVIISDLPLSMHQGHTFLATRSHCGILNPVVT